MLESNQQNQDQHIKLPDEQISLKVAETNLGLPVSQIEAKASAEKENLATTRSTHDQLVDQTEQLLRLTKLALGEDTLDQKKPLKSDVPSLPISKPPRPVSARSEKEKSKANKPQKSQRSNSSYK